MEYGDLLKLGLKVKLLLRPDDALSKVLQASSSLLGGSTQINHVVQVGLACLSLGDIFVDLLQNLKVSKPKYSIKAEKSEKFSDRNSLDENFIENQYSWAEKLTNN